MADIYIKRAHGTTLAKAKKAALGIAQQLEDKFELESDWDGNVASFTRTGVNGTLEVSKTEVEIEIKLGLLFKPFKGPIQSAIEQNLEKMFSAPKKA